MNTAQRRVLSGVAAAMSLLAAPCAHALSRPDILARDTLCFAAGRHVLTAEHRARLDALAKKARVEPQASVRLSGYCAGQGMTREYALAYCQKPVDMARTYLAGQGIGMERMVAVSYGKNQGGRTISEGCEERVEVEARLLPREGGQP